MQNVYFQKGFHDRNHPEEQRKPGMEVKVEKEFSWEGKLWKIPAVYLFEEGVVMDLCCRIDPDSLRRYYREREQFSGQGWTDSETFAFLEAKNPWPRSNCMRLNINGKDLLQEGSSGGGWVPESCSGSDGNNAAVPQNPQLWKILDDYLCDREHAWYFSRCCFRWADGEKPETADTLHAITAEFAMEPMRVPGFCFATREGDAPKSLPFRCPLDGKEGVLNIRECFSRKLEDELFRNMPAPRRGTQGTCIVEDPDVEYPLYQNVISWNVEPEWLRSACTIVDCNSSGGHPRRKSKEGEGQETGSQTSEVIGSSAVYTFYTEKDNKENSYSSSALTFEKQTKTRWQMDFIRKDSEHLLVEVLEHD